MRTAIPECGLSTRTRRIPPTWLYEAAGGSSRGNGNPPLGQTDAVPKPLAEMLGPAGRRHLVARNGYYQTETCARFRTNSARLTSTSSISSFEDAFLRNRAFSTPGAVPAATWSTSSAKGMKFSPPTATRLPSRRPGAWPLHSRPYSRQPISAPNPWKQCPSQTPSRRS
jgi:hypothetical protein